MMGASIFRYGKLIGHCSQPICSCCENQFADEAKRALDGSEYTVPHRPKGCLNFTPLPLTVELSPPVPPGRPPRVDRYCVIGVEAYQREWFPTLGGAVRSQAVREGLENEEAARGPRR